MSSARSPLALRIAAGLLLLAGLSATGTLAWMRWRDTRWLAEPGTGDLLVFSFRVDAAGAAEFAAFEGAVRESIPIDFPGWDVAVWPERRNIRIEGIRSRLGDPGAWALRITSSLKARTRDRRFAAPWRLAVIGKDGVLWGPRESEAFP